MLVNSVFFPTHVLQNPGSYDECIPIGDFSFDPHKLICCSLESGNILSHGSGGKGYGLATTAITSGCFIWKVWTSICIKKKKHSYSYLYCLLPRLYHWNVYIYQTSLFSSTSPKRTEAMRAHVLVFHAGQSEITTITPPLTCGCIVPIVATCTMEGNWSAHFLPLPRVTPSPASWTWRLTPYHLLRMTRSVQIFTVSTQGFYSCVVLCCVLLQSLRVFVFLLGAKVGIWRCGCLWTVPLCVVLQQ